MSPGSLQFLQNYSTNVLCSNMLCVVFLTQGWESGYRFAGGFQVTWLVRCQFLFCHPPLPDMPRPPTSEVLVECVKAGVNLNLSEILVSLKRG